MDASASLRPDALSGSGIGLKPQHFDELLLRRPALGFFEIHAENYMVDGGPFHHALGQIRADYPLAIHGVALSIGGAGPLDPAHVGRLARLVQRYEPAIVSEHLAWSSHGGTYFNDLLPLRYDAATLARVCDHVDQLQQRLRRRVLLENPSTYVESRASTWSEGQFVSEVLRRTGCGLLLDLNNVYVSSVNHGRDPVQGLLELPLAAAGQCHLAGFTEDCDAAGDRLLIDSHGSAVDAAVWDLFARALEVTGPLPALIEWDRDVPALDVLLREAARADGCLRAGAARRSGEANPA